MTDSSPTFAQLGLPETICTTLSRLGYEQPSAIQARAIPPLLEGKDLLGIAQTGTGKTAAFALPMLAKIDVNQALPSILVLTPTRELGIQVAEAFESYAENIKGLNVLAIYGGQEMGVQLRALKQRPQVIVGTPGRVMDHLRRGSLDLSELQGMVLDEADEMLRMGFIEDVEWILEQTPQDRQLALFSATMPGAIERICNRYLQDPTEVKIESATRTVDRISQRYIDVNASRKLKALELVMETEEFDAAIIFVRTKNSAQDLAQKLEQRGYRASALHGDLNQRQRELCISQLKDKVIDVVVATDVAARGLDVPRITHVINFDVPYDGESYIHRIGRTGRAGRSGTAILFVTQRERRMLRIIEKTTGQPVDAAKLPTRDELRQYRFARFADNLRNTLAKRDWGDLEAALDEIKTSQGLTDAELALALAAQSTTARGLTSIDQDVEVMPKSRDYDKKQDPKVRRRDDDREERPRKTRKEREAERMNIDMQRYRLAVGREQSVRVGDILGAIANELGIDSKYIGDIRLEQNYCTVELPDGMPDEVFRDFQKVRIRNFPANPQKDDGSAPEGESFKRAKPGKFSGKPGSAGRGKEGRKFGDKGGKEGRGGFNPGARGNNKPPRSRKK